MSMRSRKRNWAMAKSDAITACMPSWPLIPTPTCAAWIMPTSLAPSPMPSVVRPDCFTSAVTCAFWMGETRQQTTDSQAVHSSSSRSHSSSLSACERERPSMTTAASPFIVCRFVFAAFSCCFTESNAFCFHSELTMLLSPAAFAASARLSRLIMNCSIPGRSMLHAMAMLMAVSCLSPVSTQILMPPAASAAMVAGTPSCSLSSMEVEPSRVRFFSMSSPTASSFLSRSCSAVFASTYFLCHASNSLGCSSTMARHRVRRPACASCSMCSCVARVNRLASSVFARRSRTIASAPLQKSTIRPSGKRQMVLMRLRAEENSSCARTSYVASVGALPGSRASRTVTLVCVRVWKKNPKRLAATTNAASSGDSHW
mmetsp:Transcript_13669/g.47220  ORF Transcript_13669/g.47220 Transcript_13669/m.47220 type:complete len:372 (-) Transcript_13669:1755-2870(-)